jgi:hypothetical protein
MADRCGPQWQCGGAASKRGLSGRHGPQPQAPHAPHPGPRPRAARPGPLASHPGGGGRGLQWAHAGVAADSVQGRGLTGTQDGLCGPDRNLSAAGVGKERQPAQCLRALQCKVMRPPVLRPKPAPFARAFGNLRVCVRTGRFEGQVAQPGAHRPGVAGPRRPAACVGCGGRGGGGVNGGGRVRASGEALPRCCATSCNGWLHGAVAW